MVSESGVGLLPEQALAQRWLRERFAPLEVWQWLAGRAPQAAHFSPPTPPRLKSLLAELGAPLAERSNEHERKALDHTLSLTAALFAFIHGKIRPGSEACQRRMLAASILPLYRGLARGSVEEVTSVMRRQLADSLALAALVCEFAPVAELLDNAMSRDEMPHQALESALNIELDQLAERLLVCGHGWSGDDEAELRQLIASDVRLDVRPPWGTPQVLWQLAGEMTADRAEFVVPRDWIRVPVPWNEATEHWREIARALEEPPVSTTDQAASNSSPTGRGAALSEPSHDEVARLKLEIEIADSIDTLVQESRTAAHGLQGIGGSTRLRSRWGRDEFIVPKIIIAEVRSHNDPAFIAVVRRQLASCRNVGSTLSLIAVRVQPDGAAEENSSATLQSLGLAAWQQKLVNWLSDHPDVHEPYAFVSSSGELILCLMDIERNAATSLLRQGLLQVLTGKAVSDQALPALTRVPVPARYHSGISSVSSPAASLEAEQLIEATFRCLAAAERHGKAAIKSIEVF